MAKFQTDFGPPRRGRSNACLHTRGYSGQSSCAWRKKRPTCWRRQPHKIGSKRHSNTGYRTGEWTFQAVRNHHRCINRSGGRREGEQEQDCTFVAGELLGAAAFRLERAADRSFRELEQARQNHGHLRSRPEFACQVHHQWHGRQIHVATNRPSPQHAHNDIFRPSRKRSLPWNLDRYHGVAA